MLQDVLDKIDHDNLRNSPDILKNIAMKVPEKPIQGIKTIETDKRPNPAHDARIKAIQDKNDDKPEKKNNESTSSSKNRYAPKQKRSSWSKNESEVLKKLHEIYGRRWKTISRFTNTRTPAEVKPPRFWVLYKNKNRYKISSLQVGASKWFPEDKISEIEKWGRTKSQSQSNELGRRETGKQEGIMGSAPLEECSMLAPRMSPTSIIHLVGDLILAMVFSVWGVLTLNELSHFIVGASHQIQEHCLMFHYSVERRRPAFWRGWAGKFFGYCFKVVVDLVYVYTSISRPLVPMCWEITIGISFSLQVAHLLRFLPKSLTVHSKPLKSGFKHTPISRRDWLMGFPSFMHQKESSGKRCKNSDMLYRELVPLLGRNLQFKYSRKEDCSMAQQPGVTYLAGCAARSVGSLVSNPADNIVASL
ncbi:hypothetical protein JRO89_XS08G0102100 [Xanthoceras sorbifolium]|uniref:Uncharacterized protein n=1 Tax=Xanthoceras sorbifolium TaxID=99658 RepID=A0ABQ8HP74_9ROSI|nr:hypothetical protein JRO89_XS08G0102100 [Xanthoceras sorbifolium]